MIFDGIYGHDDIKQKLAGAISNNAVSHAYIFCGGDGIGKTSVALKFAQCLTQNSAPDLIIVSNERYGIKKTAFSVDAVRAARADMYVKPYIADKKVFIFPKADTMTPAAQNALLKVLEEPPPYVVIILISTSTKILLPTIRSRALTVRFSPLPDNVVGQYLKEKYNASFDGLAVRLCGGSIKAADALMSNEGLYDRAKEFAAVFERFTGIDKLQIYKAIEYFEKEKEKSDIFFDVMSIMLSGSLLGGNGAIQSNKIDKGAAVKIIVKIQNAKRAINQNRNYSIVISELLLDTWRALHD